MLEDAEQLIEGEDADTIRALRALRDASFFEAEATAGGALRLRMHEPIRREVMGRAPAADIARARARHAAYFARRGAGWARGYYGPGGPECMSSLVAQRANMRAAWRWAMEHEPEAAARLIAAMEPMLTTRGSTPEALSMCRATLEVVASDEARRSVLLVLVKLALLRGGYAVAWSMSEEVAGALTPDMEDAGRWWALRVHLAVVLGKHDEADETLALALEVPDASMRAEARVQQGVVHLVRGEVDEAEAALERALLESSELGAMRHEALTHALLGRVHRARGDMARTLRALKVSCASFERLGEVIHAAKLAGHLAQCFAELGDEASARRWAERTWSPAVRSGDVPYEAVGALGMHRAGWVEGDEVGAKRWRRAMRDVAQRSHPVAQEVSEWWASAVDAALATEGEALPEVCVSRDGAWLVRGGERRDLSGKQVLKPLLACLARWRVKRPYTSLDAHSVFEAVWPGETIAPDYAAKRVHTAVWSLRGEGLEGFLVTDDGGYRLDGRVAVV